MTTRSNREKQLAGEIKSMMSLAREAEARGSFSAAVNARRSVSTLRQELDRLRVERLTEAEDDPLARIQLLRRQAAEAGSYTAASGLLKAEADLIAAREAAQAVTDDGFEEASPADIMEAIEAAIVSLPDTLVVQLKEAIEARLEGHHLRLVSSDS